jgi:hypothetical protein
LRRGYREGYSHGACKRLQLPPREPVNEGVGI